MIKISKELDYALIILTALAQAPKDSYVGLKTLSDQRHLPYKFIGTIATKLKDNHILESKEGNGGGYRLTQPTNQITLNQIITVLHGPLTPSHLMDCAHCHTRHTCQHQQSFISLIQTIARSFDQATLADVIGQ
jgi:Rrf2 family protein